MMFMKLEKVGKEGEETKFDVEDEDREETEDGRVKRDELKSFSFFFFFKQ